MFKSTFAKSLVSGRRDFSPKAKKILKEMGDESITKMVIVRSPLGKTLMAMMNAVTLGAFKKRMKGKPYDELFHLRIDITTGKGVVSVEKNEVVTLTKSLKAKKREEAMEVTGLPTNMTLTTLLNTTREKIGDKKFWVYQAKDLNCQQFISDILQSNKLGTQQHLAFVKQDTDSLFDKSNFLRKTSNTLTDVASRLDVVA
jgi:hypothetical protein